MNTNLGFGTADAAGWLVHQNPGVWGRVALAWRTGRQEELAHGCCETHGDGYDVIGNEFHRVIDGHPRGDRATRRVDVQEDVSFRVFSTEQQHLGCDHVRVVISNF